MPLTRLDEKETVAFRRLLRGALAELGADTDWLYDAFYERGGPADPRDARRSLFERQRVSARAAMMALDCIVRAARKRAMVLRTKPADDLVFWGFEAGGSAVFQPAEAGDEGLTLSQLQRAVFAGSNVSASYYLRIIVAKKAGRFAEDSPAERIQDDAALNAMLNGRRHRRGSLT